MDDLNEFYPWFHGVFDDVVQGLPSFLYPEEEVSLSRILRRDFTKYVLPKHVGLDTLTVKGCWKSKSCCSCWFCCKGVLEMLRHHPIFHRYFSYVCSRYQSKKTCFTTLTLEGHLYQPSSKTLNYLVITH